MLNKINNLYYIVVVGFLGFTAEGAGFNGKKFELTGRMVHTSPGALTIKSSFHLWLGDGIRGLDGEVFFLRSDSTVDSHCMVRWRTSFKGSTSVVEHLEPRTTPLCAISRGVQIRGSDPWDSLSLLAFLTFNKPFFEKAATEGFLDPWRIGVYAQASPLRPEVTWSTEKPGIAKRIEFYYDEKLWEKIQEKYGPRNRAFWQPPPWPFEEFKNIPWAVAEVKEWFHVAGLQLPKQWLVEYYKKIDPLHTDMAEVGQLPITLLPIKSMPLKVQTNFYSTARTVITMASIKEVASIPSLTIPEGVLYEDFRAADAKNPGINVRYFRGLQPGTAKWSNEVEIEKRLVEKELKQRFWGAQERAYVRKKRIWSVIFFSGIIGITIVLFLRKSKIKQRSQK